MKIIVALIGKNGAGKGAVAQIFGKYFQFERGCHTATVVFSDLLKETLTLWGVEHTRENLQALPLIMENAFGVPGGEPHLMAEVICNRIEKMNTSFLVVDGGRWLTDEAMLRKLGAVFVFVRCPAELRYQRLKARKEKAGEEFMSWEDFQRQDNAENERYILDIGGRADFEIDNSTGEEELAVLAENVAHEIALGRQCSHSS
jgi:dephospho-CoA kinase